MHHFVYWLFDPETSELLYIGRSHQPDRRKRDFERLYERKTVAGVHHRYQRLEDAQDHELAVIQKHRPAYNKKLTSSPTSLGMVRAPASLETRAKMRTAKLGRKLSEEHKQHIRASSGRYSRPGMRWITNESEDKHYPRDDALPHGWRPGRKPRPI